MRTVARNHTHILARLRTTMVQATRHNGRNDTTGIPVLPEEAWAAYASNTHAPRAYLRELDPGQLYEVRVHGTLRYELRPAAAQHASAERIDAILTRHPDGPTGVRLFLNGVEIDSARIHEHHVDPGAVAPDAEEDWLTGMLTAGAGAQRAVLDALTAEAAPYR